MFRKCAHVSKNEKAVQLFFLSACSEQGPETGDAVSGQEGSLCWQRREHALIKNVLYTIAAPGKCIFDFFSV